MPHKLSSLKAHFSKILGNRALLLPSDLLKRYVASLLKKRDLLLKSAIQLGTPQYFFDEPALTQALSTFHRVFSRHLGRFRIFYAVKSNSFPGLCKHVSDTGHGLDVSSGVELTMALSLGCKNILFSGPAKTETELTLAIQNRDKIILLMDSAAELERVAGLVRNSDLGDAPLKVGFRLRGQHHGIWGKFGIPPERFPNLFSKALAVKGLDPQGIQFHTSWNMGPEAQVKMIERVGACIKALPVSSQCRLKFVDIGGGYWPERGEWLNPQNTMSGKLLQILDPDFDFKPRHYYHPARPLEDFAREISAAILRSACIIAPVGGC